MTIQAITVRISDGIKTGDYAPSKLYDLSANVIDFDNVDEALASAIATLQRAGDHFLGRAVAPKYSITTGDGVNKAPLPSETEIRSSTAEPTKRTRRTKAEIEADLIAAQAGKDAGREGADPTLLAEGDAALDAAIEEDFTGLEDFDALEPVATITDADLNDAVQKKNREIANPVAIRTTIAEFIAPPGQLRQIKQEDRAAFLVKLVALKKA